MAPTTAVYFDAALVAKFYVNEPGRDAVRRLAKRAGTVATSGIAIAEVAAAFHRKLREGSIDDPMFEALQGQFHHDVRETRTTLRSRRVMASNTSATLCGRFPRRVDRGRCHPGGRS